MGKFVYKESYSSDKATYDNGDCPELVMAKFIITEATFDALGNMGDANTDFAIHTARQVIEDDTRKLLAQVDSTMSNFINEGIDDFVFTEIDFKMFANVAAHIKTLHERSKIDMNSLV